MASIARDCGDALDEVEDAQLFGRRRKLARTLQARACRSPREQRRRIRRVALQLVAVERDAEAGRVGDREVALAVEGEGALDDAVEIGAAADELDEVDIR